MYIKQHASDILRNIDYFQKNVKNKDKVCVIKF